MRSQPIRMSSCKMSDGDLVKLEALYTSGAFSLDRVAELRAAAAEPYEPPPLAALKALDSIAVWNRTWCTNVLFKVSEPDGDTLWKFVFGKQSPILACLVRVYECDMPDLLMSVAAPLHGMADMSWDYAFQEDWSDFAFSDDGRWQVEWRCSVLSGVCYNDGKMLVADGRWAPFDEVKAMFAKVPGGDGAEERRFF